MKRQGSFPKGELAAQSCELAGWAEKGETTAKAPAGTAVPTEGSAQTRWHSSTHSGAVLGPGWFRCSQAVVCGSSPGSWTLPSLWTHSWTPPARAAMVGNGQGELWELEGSWNETVTPLISWEGRKETSVLSTIAAGWHIPRYSVLLALITQTFSI